MLLSILIILLIWDPDFVQAYNNRAAIKNVLGQYESAINDCNKAICLKPDHANAYANRGNAKVWLGRVMEARSDYQTALDLANQIGDNDLKVKMTRRVQELGNAK